MGQVLDKFPIGRVGEPFTTTSRFLRRQTEMQRVALEVWDTNTGQTVGYELADTPRSERTDALSVVEWAGPGNEPVPVAMDASPAPSR